MKHDRHPINCTAWLLDPRLRSRQLHVSSRMQKDLRVELDRIARRHWNLEEARFNGLLGRVFGKARRNHSGRLML
ncbi:hypothetical protein QL093DRAFT_1048490 [Fusarium oxysporum]|nr:hypothetical protein QL093DRAFT_1048490 [Fusarium oxysporum]